MDTDKVIAVMNETESLMATGDIGNTIEMLRAVADQDPMLQLQLARALFEVGCSDEAVRIFVDLSSLPQTKLHAAPLAARTSLAVGFPELAQRAATKALELDGNARDVAYVLGVACMDTGDVLRAYRIFDAILAKAPEDPAFYRREVCRWVLAHAYERNASPDAAFTRDFKIAEVDGRPVTLAIRIGVSAGDGPCWQPLTFPPLSDAQRALCRDADALGALFELNTAGFSRNRRLCRAMALGAIEAANALRSGAVQSSRDFMDILVRWRRTACNGDSVWWGTGCNDTTCLRTPLYKGTRAVYRYQRYLERALDCIRNLALGDVGLAGIHDALRGAACTPRAIHSAFGQDVSVAMHVGAEKFPGTTFCIHKTDDSYDVFCYTVLAEDRTRQFHARLDDLLRAFVAAPHTLRPISLYFYYWCNFQCLSRGSIICGLAAMLAMFLCTGSVPAVLSPRDVQWDWEAMLETSETVFADKLEGHLRSAAASPVQLLVPLASGTPIVEMYSYLAEPSDS
jgi:hypothetical protein